MTPDRMALRSETRSKFTIDFSIFGSRLIYGFWATGYFYLSLPERYLQNLKIDGRYNRTFCEIYIRGRKRPVTIGMLATKRSWLMRKLSDRGLVKGHDGLKLWSWREAPLKEARQAILAALEREKQSWDKERISATDSGAGKAIL